MKKPGVLIADDEPDILSALEGFIKGQPWDVLTAPDGQVALDLLTSHHIDVAVLDLRMPYLDGLAVLDEVRRRDIDTDVVILTAFGSIPRAVRALKGGAKDFLLKPIRKAEFADMVRKLIQVRYPTPHVLAERLDVYVEANASDPDLTLSAVMAAFSISRSYASQLFAELGTSFRERLILYRITKAKRLLKNTDEPVYAIAELCGFRNARRLAEVFQRIEGMTPTQYRQIGGR